MDRHRRAGKLAPAGKKQFVISPAANKLGHPTGWPNFMILEEQAQAGTVWAAVAVSSSLTSCSSLRW
jgi:hypothetical protein